MGFNLFDIAVLGYVAYGLWRGHHRGLSQELPRVVGILVFVMTGFGIFRWTSRGLSSVSQTTGVTLGIVGFVLLVAGAWWISGRLSRRISSLSDKHIADKVAQKKLGMIVGGLRTLVIGCFIIVYLWLLPLGELSKPFSGGSFFGRNLIQFIVPVYEKVAGEPVRSTPQAGTNEPSPQTPKPSAYTPSSKRF